MTIADAFNKISVDNGGTASKSGTIAGAIDALNDALAGSDQEAAATIEEAVALLGSHISSGGGGATKHSITYLDASTLEPISACLSDKVKWHDWGGGSGDWVADGEFVSEALPGAILALSGDTQRSLAAAHDADGHYVPMASAYITMPDFGIVVTFY